MPADSDPRPDVVRVELPHAWRPLGVRIAGVVLGALMLLVGAWAWNAFPPSIQDDFTWPQRVTVVLLALLFLGMYYAMARSRIVARTQGLMVINGFRRRELEWAEIVRVSMPRGAPWVRFDLADGTTLSGLGVQSSDGDRAVRAFREIRGLVEQHSARDADSPGD